ncbi:unnamed protein product [Cylicocyclus nassatus]|uniref:Peptidase A1 domain-containing protein n=1 Tax=Cylicocyclus nassatus TaxID=53992 RepID=A0AA36DJV6_CYLNA|nr:unnamed protein product [Cylicocyclus nassatus]
MVGIPVWSLMEPLTLGTAMTANYVPLSAETYWQFPIAGFSIGSFSETKKERVISDTGTSWIGAPASVVSGVVKQTGAKYDFANELYTVPCSTQKTQPDLVFTISGVKYNIPSVEYVLDFGLGNGKCALTFFGMNSADLAHHGFLETLGSALTATSTILNRFRQGFPYRTLNMDLIST